MKVAPQYSGIVAMRYSCFVRVVVNDLVQQEVKAK